jgi:hypothetical protein
VTRHAKASSARSITRQDGSGHVVCGALTTGVAIALALLAAFAPLSQAKVVVDGFGPPGSLGGQISSPRTVAINSSGNGAPAGAAYVAEANRVQRFSPSGAFERIWGGNVIAPGKPGDTGNGFEICTVASACQGGQAEADSISFNGGPSGIALNQTTGNVYVIDQGRSRVTEFDPEGNFLRLWGWDVVKAGGVGDVSTDAFEICTAASDCKAGVSGANGGQIQRVGSSSSLVIDPSGNVWVPDPGNRRIQEFDSSGNFIAVYGYNVDAFGGGGTLEKCTSTAVGACQAGTEGSGQGQFSAGYPTDIAFDSSGNLYAIDGGNSRVQKLDPTLLASATTFGASTFAAYTSSWSEPSGSLVRMTAVQGGTRLLFSLKNDVTANPSEYQLIEVDPIDASVKDTSLVGSGLEAINGLGDDPTTGVPYVTTTSSNSPFGVLALGSPLPDPAVALDAVTTKTDTTATFSASIDPKGGIVGCKFEYSTDQSNWNEVSPSLSCSSLSVNGGPQALSASVTGLTPSQKYFVRLQTSRPLVAGSTKTSNAKFFSTDAPPPVITDVGAVNIADTSARLVATIDPRHSATGYVFEYGTTPGLGASTAPLAIGASTTPLTVSQVVGGLSKDTTYYFRVAATNLTGTTTTALHTLHTRANPLPLPDDRGWEMVTPPDKNYSDANNVAAGRAPEAGIAPDGNSAGFCTTALFGEPTGKMALICAPYMVKRTAGGWQTTDSFPNYCKVDPVVGSENVGLSAYLSADFSRLVIRKPESAGCSIPPLDPAAPLATEEPGSEGEPSPNLYFQDLATDPLSYDLLNSQPGADYVGETFTGGSEDFGHVVYQSINNQTPYPGDSPAPGKFHKIYDWEQQGQGACTQPGGCLTLASKDPSNEPFETNSRTVQAPATAIYSPSAVSSDGRRIFFQNPVPEFAGGIGLICGNAGCELYMREDATTTYDVSASECTLGPACGSAETKADVFVAATPSGAAVFFTSCAKLTDASVSQSSCVAPLDGNGATGEDGAKLYRWDRNAAPGHRLVDLIIDHEPGDGEQPNFRGLIGESSDGNTAYFVAGGQIVSGEPTGPGDKIYRWQWNNGNPTVDYLGPHQTVPLPGISADINWAQFRRHVTLDGKYLTIFTKLALDPAADRDSDADLYRWDESDGWACISCQLPGVASAGEVDLLDVKLLASSNDVPALASAEPRVFMSENGQRIFFATPDALVPEDVNGEVGCPQDQSLGLISVGYAPIYTCEDVYEWHEGTVSLISSGTGAGASYLIGSTPSGSDVLFYTSQRLVGWDTDTNTDIYDARVGGGFPEPPAQPPSCEGESCRGGGTSAPAPTGAGTAVFQGQGNPAPKHKATRKHHKKRHRKHQQRAKHDRRAGR